MYAQYHQHAAAHHVSTRITQLLLILPYSKNSGKRYQHLALSTDSEFDHSLMDTDSHHAGHSELATSAKNTTLSKYSSLKHMSKSLKTSFAPKIMLSTYFQRAALQIGSFQ
jgi:hypothetical protein